MDRYDNPKQPARRRGLLARHPIIINLLIIAVVAALGVAIAYFSLSLFTKHGETDKVPAVVNLKYSTAVEKLHDAGFKVEIRDYVFMENVKPGIVVEQFPASGAVVKPGRKVFLYINAVHPKEIVIDPAGDSRLPALRGVSMRQALAQLQEQGFKNIKIRYVLGDSDRVIKVTSDGNVIFKLQKVPINARLTVEVYDGRKSAIIDSLQNAEFAHEIDIQEEASSATEYSGGSYTGGTNGAATYTEEATYELEEPTYEPSENEAGAATELE